MASKRSSKPSPKGAHRRPVSPAQPARAIVQRAAAQLPVGYGQFLDGLKARIRASQVKASLSVNRHLIELYWSIGRDIVLRQQAEGWGKAVVDRLAADLQREFPAVSGLSSSNLWRMRAFYLAYFLEQPELAQPVRESKSGEILAHPVRELDAAVLKHPVSEIPWGHNVVLVERLKDLAQRLWYAQQTIANGWSRAMLLHWIDSDLFARQGKAVTNFKATLPGPQSDLAGEIIKDPYNFDFLTLRTDAAERDLEQGLLDHIQRFLLEMGAGFAFVGRQVHLEVEKEDFYLDLLFYHLHLRCFVVIDLKVQPFKPEFAGKMNFYLSAVDDLMRHADDQPSIGLILCREKNRITAEYALRDLRKPIGVAGWQTKITESLPRDLRGSLPSIRQIEAELKDAKRERTGNER